MRIEKPWIKVEKYDPIKIMKRAEFAARVCYHSLDKITENSYRDLLPACIKNGHMSPFYHEKITVYIFSDIGSYKDLTRHHHADFCVESTRWCNYTKNKFNNEITFIDPVNINSLKKFDIWENAMIEAEKNYFALSECTDASADQLRMLLPHSTAAHYIMSANIAEWYHILKTRCRKNVHPSIRQVLIPLLLQFKKDMPEIFGNIEYDTDFNSANYAELSFMEDY